MDALAALAVALGPSAALREHVVPVYKALEKCKFDKVLVGREGACWWL